MKFITLIFIITCFLIPTNVLGQEMPAANIVSKDTFYCETDLQNITIRVEFIGGEPPYSFEYMVNDQYGFEDGGGNISGNSFEWGISPSNTSNIILLEVFDQNNMPVPRDQTEDDLSQYGGGSDLVYGSMEIRVDKMPMVNAGLDDEVCGYEYNMTGEVTGATTNVWWSDPVNGAIFNDITSPTAKLTATIVGDYRLTLNADNGECSAQDDVDITLKGRPTGTITNNTDWRFCSSDVSVHALPIELSFTGSGDFTYTLKDEDENAYGPFTSSANNDNRAITISKNNTISIQSVEDGQGCLAEAADMQGSRTAIDVKPDVFAGDDVAKNCGVEYTLNATASPETSGKWTSLTPDITFADDTQHNSLCTATFSANETFKDAKLRWTETTIDELSCTSYHEIDIKFVQLPTLALNSLSDEQLCEDRSTTLDFEVTGNAPWTMDYNLGGAQLSKSFTQSDKQLNILGSDLLIGNNVINITKIKDSFNCESVLSLTQNILVDEMPVANAGPDQEVCGTKVNLEAIPYFEQGEWILSTGLFSDKNDPTATFTANDTGVLNLVWKETNGVCVDRDTVEVTFFDAPYPVKDVNDTLIVYAAKSVELTALPLIVGTGQWSIQEPTVTGASITDPNLHNASLTNLNTKQIYKLEWKATLESAPEDCREKTYNVIVDSNPMLAPTGISPDGDGINDELIILGAKENSRLTVFDKNGKLVYKTDKFNNNWKGTDHTEAKLAPGTYFYVYQDDEVTVKNYLIIKY